MSFIRTNCKSKTLARSIEWQASFRLGAVAWFTAQAGATISNSTSGALTTNNASEVNDYALTVTLTWTGLDSNPVQVDDKGHEHVYIGSGTDNLRDLDATADERTARADVVRYFTVNVSVASVTTAYNAEIAAAIAGKKFKGTISLSGDRFVLFKTAPTLETAGWHTTDITSSNKIEFDNLQIGTNTSGENPTWQITNAGAATADFYVVVKGQSGTESSVSGGTLTLSSLTSYTPS